MPILSVPIVPVKVPVTCMELFVAPKGLSGDRPDIYSALWVVKQHSVWKERYAEKTTPTI